MEPTLPFWFQQRQAKAESAGTNIYRLIAPNLREAYITIRAHDGRWTAALMESADGAEVAVSDLDFKKPDEAWQAAFELYRRHFVT